MKTILRGWPQTERQIVTAFWALFLIAGFIMAVKGEFAAMAVYQLAMFYSWREMRKS